MKLPSGSFQYQTLKDVTLKREELPNGNRVRYFLDITYEYKDVDGVHILRLPKVLLPINENCIPIIDHLESYPYQIPKWYAKFSFGDLPLLEDENRIVILDKIIKPAVQEMTLDEIEEKLGYKVKIVSEKGED